MPVVLFFSSAVFPILFTILGQLKLLLVSFLFFASFSSFSHSAEFPHTWSWSWSWSWSRSWSACPSPSQSCINSSCCWFWSIEFPHHTSLAPGPPSWLEYYYAFKSNSQFKLLHSDCISVEHLFVNPSDVPLLVPTSDLCTSYNYKYTTTRSLGLTSSFAPFGRSGRVTVRVRWG